MNKDTVIYDLSDFMSKYLGLDEQRIKPEASIQNDLNIYGDDAFEFIVEFGKKFSVDVSQFMAAEYFRGEDFDTLGSIYRFITRKKNYH